MKLHTQQYTHVHVYVIVHTHVKEKKKKDHESLLSQALTLMKTELCKKRVYV